MKDFKLSVRVYPIQEPLGNTLAFANAYIEDLVAIRGIRVISGEKGLFVSMPQTKDKEDKYHDIAYPLNGVLRETLKAVILDEYDAVLNGKSYERSNREKPQSLEEESQNSENKEGSRGKPEKPQSLEEESQNSKDKEGSRGKREKPQSLEEKLKNGKDKAARQATARSQNRVAAKGSPGLGD